MSDVFCAIHGSQYMTTAGVCQMCAAAPFVGSDGNLWRARKDGVLECIAQPTYDPASLTFHLSVEGEEKFTYTFRPAPAHGSSFSRSLDAVFELVPMITLDFTEAEFKQFRLDLLRDGFELHEVSRVPYHTPETIL
jgi:hypothetical protein